MRKKCHVLFEWPPYVPLRLSLLSSLTVQCCLETPCHKGTYTNVNKKNKKKFWWLASFYFEPKVLIRKTFFSLKYQKPPTSWSFDFWCSDHPKNTFDVLTLRCSDFRGPTPSHFFQSQVTKTGPVKNHELLKLGPSNGFILKWFSHLLSF